MRRSLATLILTLALWAGSFAWSGFLALNTVLDPDRSERVANTLYEDDAVREQLVDNIADAIERGLPEGVPVPREQLEASAEAALDSPVVRDQIVGALVAAHQAFLGEGDPPESIDAGAFGSVARDALVQTRPELAGVIPPAPSFEIPLPTERIPDLGGLRRVLQAAVPTALLLALGGATLALTVTSHRPAVLRRTAYWAFGASAGVVLFAFGIPALARRFAPDQAEVVAGFIAALAETTRGPAVGLALGGAALFGVSFVWKAVPGVGSLLAGDPGSDRGVRPIGTRPDERLAARPLPPRTIVQSPPTQVQQTPVSTSRDSSRPTYRPAPDGFGPERPPVPDPAPGYPEQAPPPGPPRRWVEGHGWVLDGNVGDIPDSARWVPGVGYVLDDS